MWTCKCGYWCSDTANNCARCGWAKRNRVKPFNEFEKKIEKKSDKFTEDDLKSVSL